MGERTADAVVVGAGIAGACVALELARAGLHVTVLERSVPGAEASSAAAGILSPSMEAREGGIALELGKRSAALHATWAETLRERHGIDVGHRRCGVLLASFGAAETQGAAELLARVVDAGIEARAMSGDEARRLEPSLAGDVQSALVFDEDAQVDPRALLRALLIAAEAAGVRFVSGAYVDGVVVEQGRVRGVRTTREQLATNRVVVAAGSWTSLVAGLGLRSDAVRPVRGQMLATEWRPPIFRRIVFSGQGYVVARPDGRVICGSTMEEAGFRRDVTLGGLEQIARTARRIAPLLEHAPVLDSWSNFRPATPDGLPLIGRTAVDGLLLATGHFRNGILLAPITATLIRELIESDSTSLDIRTLSPLRFAG